MKKTNLKTVWWYVYRGINHTKKEVYHGASKDVNERKNGSHCIGSTKTIRNWNCEVQTINWSKISKHKTQSKASEISHKLERNYKFKDFLIIQTKGI